MKLSGMHKAETRRYAFGLLGLSLLMTFLVGPFVSVFGYAGAFAYIFLVGALALSGFVLLIASAFLPADRREQPNFMEDLMGEERLQFGPVYTEGNWMTVIENEDESKKHG